MNDGYHWVLAAHILSVIAWMAGMLYLPRLFVYHTEAPGGSPQAATFTVMERRLLKAIINPAMLAVLITGVWIAIWGSWFQSGWLHAKLALVVLMLGAHGFFSGSVRRFAEGRNTRSSGFWRAVNEVPTVLLILIVILAVVKPF